MSPRLARSPRPPLHRPAAGPAMTPVATPTKSPTSSALESFEVIAYASMVGTAVAARPTPRAAAGESGLRESLGTEGASTAADPAGAATAESGAEDEARTSAGHSATPITAIRVQTHRRDSERVFTCDLPQHGARSQREL